MERYKFIDVQNSEEVALFFEELFIRKCSDTYLVDPYINKHVYMNIQQVRDYIFKSKIFGFYSLNSSEEEIENYMMVFIINRDEQNTK